jgi:4-amino-4-deoxy-L-arabinose transferase-like glycosyltransferase
LHPSALAKRLYILLFVVIIAFYFYGLGQLPLLGPDEPRYAQVAREMFQRGDFVTPTLGGHTWFEKPALLYWLIMASFKIFGVSEFSARVGPALCGLMTVAAMWFVARAVERDSEQSAGFAFWSTLVAASSLGLIVFSRAASFDVVVTMTIAWALAFFLRYELDARKRVGFLGGFYACVGLSLLAKGLVGIVVPFGVLGLYYLLRRRWPNWHVWLSLVWGVPLALAVSAIWYGPVIARHGWTFIDEFFIQHHFARFVSNKYHHPQPIYFYPVIILLLALPWTPYLVLALIRARRWTWRDVDSQTIIRVFALAWLVMPILFFSFSRSKLPGYILPALPAATLLIAGRLAQTTSRWPLAIFGSTLVLVLIVLQFVAPSFAARESVRDLLRLADARGYANAPVLAQRSDDRSAQFYAHDRVIYNAQGEPITFDEITLEEARALGPRIVVFIPVRYVEDFRGAPKLEVLGDNGRIAVLGWTP